MKALGLLVSVKIFENCIFTIKIENETVKVMRNLGDRNHCNIAYEKANFSYKCHTLFKFQNTKYEML